jgi:hypothetical protein
MTMMRLITRLRARRFSLIAIAAAGVSTLAPGLAEACTVAQTPTKQAFQQFGDSSQYSLAPEGSFESGTTGWTLTGAAVKSGNESYHVNAATDSRSLSIPANGGAISAPICVSSGTPTFRFFARQTSGGWAEMNVNVLWTDSSGVAHSTTAGGFSATTSWVASQAYNLGSMLPLEQPGSTLSVRLQFVPAPTGGGLAVDDVEVDPYSK